MTCKEKELYILETNPYLFYASAGSSYLPVLKSMWVKLFLVEENSYKNVFLKNNRFAI